jgi:hypothetical protein
MFVAPQLVEEVITRGFGCAYGFWLLSVAPGCTWKRIIMA